MKNLEKILPVIAIVVALGSATFSFFQSQTSAAQFKLIEQQLRPHIHFTPIFFKHNEELLTEVHMHNESTLPANVIFSDIALWIGENSKPITFHTLSPDIIYQGKGGGSSLPAIDKNTLKKIENNEIELLIATCSIYTSTSNTDIRRWQILSMHKYIPDGTLPSRLFIKEELIENNITSCNAENVKALFKESKKI